MNPTIDYEKVRELYDRGLSDKKIADRVNCGNTQIWRWRTGLNLPCHTHEKISKYDKQIKELYDRGLNDSEIIRQAHCGKNAVRRWRAKHGLPPNKPPKSAASKKKKSVPPKQQAAANVTTGRNEDKVTFDSAFKRINTILGTMDEDDIPEVTKTYYTLSKEIFEENLNKYFVAFKQRKTTVKAANNDGGSKST